MSDIIKKLLANESLTIGAGQAMAVIAAVAQTLQIMQGRVWVAIAGKATTIGCPPANFCATADSHIGIEADKASSLVQVQ